MSAIGDWGAKRNKLFAMFVQLVAVCTKPCFDLVIKSREKAILRRANQIGLEDWVRLYQMPWRVEGMVIHCLSDPRETGSLAETIGEYRDWREDLQRGIRTATELRLTGKVSLDDMKEAQRELDKYYHEVHVPMLHEMLRGNVEEPLDMAPLPAQAEFVFFMTVAMPCWLEERETVWSLYAKACANDFKALETLARYDEFCTHDATLGKIAFRIGSQQPEQHALLRQAMDKGRKRKFTLGMLKYSLGGLLIRWSQDWDWIARDEPLHEAILRCVPASHQRLAKRWVTKRRKAIERISTGCLLQPSDVRDLYNAIAKDLGKDADPHFSKLTDTVRKQLSRKSELWPSLRQTDINRAA